MAARESQGGPRTIEAADAERARLQSEILALREALKRRDASCARPPLAAAAASLSMTVTDATVRLAERPALGALIETREAECAVEDGATVEEATRDMRARRFGGRAEEALRPPVMLSKAIAAAEARAVSRDMVNKVRTTGECLRAYFGDVPLERLADRNERVAFLLVSRRFSGAGPGRGGATVSAGRRACMAGGSVSTLGDGLGEIPGVRSQRRSTAGSSGVGAAVSAIETMASGAVAAASLRTAVVIVGRGP